MGPFHDPAGVDHVREPDGVVRVQVGQQHRADCLRREPGNPVPDRCRGGPPHDAGPGVHDIG